jgi:signal transduction histidine kinase
LTISRQPPGPPPGGQQRTEALRRYAIADNTTEPSFDRLCQAAARMLHTPAAAVVFSDGERDWFKAHCGFPSQSLSQLIDGQPRSALFSQALAHDGVLVVEDCSVDAHFKDDGWVAGTPDVRFFAGAPIRTPDGISVGVLAVFDSVCRPGAAVDCDALATLAAVVMDEAVLRATAGSPSPQAPLPLDVAWEWDLVTNQVMRNDSVYMVLRYRPETVKGEIDQAAWWYDRIHPTDQKRVNDGVQRAIEAGTQVWSDEYRFLRGDGTWADIFDRGIISRDPTGKAVRIVGSMLDVSERRRTESRLAQAERLASLGTLAAGVAHEINNPLTYVLANVGFVADRLGRMGRSLPPGVTLEWADELGELGAALAEAQEGALRVRRIVRDLRVFSDHDDEKVGPIDLHRSLESAITVAIHEIGPRARLVRHMGPVPAVEASESRLAQLFVNLLVNAAQAIGPGGFETNEIRVITETDGQGRAVVRVQDTGQGIAGETIGRIFDPFFTTKPLGGGLGLGLFVAHGIVKALGGDIAVDSVPGKGTTFRVTLPPSERGWADRSADSGRVIDAGSEHTPTPTGPVPPRSPALPPK